MPKTEYRIPILKIQDFLLCIEDRAEFIELEKFCKENLTEFCNCKIEFNLERQWFPVVVTDDRYLASKLMRKYG